MRRLVSASALVALVMLWSSCTGGTSNNSAPGNEPAPSENEPAGESSSAPDFSFETFEGETFSLAEQRGTPVVLNFWESW